MYNKLNFSFFPAIRSNTGFVGNYESAGIDTTIDVGGDDVDSKMIPDQILLSDYKRAGHFLQVGSAVSLLACSLQ